MKLQKKFEKLFSPYFSQNLEKVEGDVTLNCSKNAREDCQIDKARGFLKQDDAADRSNWLKVFEK